VNVSEAFGPAPEALVKPPAVSETLRRLVVLGMVDTAGAAREHGAIVIEPDNSDVGILDFHLLDRMREAGRRATAEALERAGDALFRSTV
jgi:predicted acylesterase/phospholipase RssA